MYIDIVFQNQHFVIINKPSGILSVPSRMGVSDPRPVAGILLQSQLKSKIFPVHRLDEEVSGLMLFALTSEAHRYANKWFEFHEVTKSYIALSVAVNSELIDKYMRPCIWKCKLMRGKKRAYEAEFGKPSITEAMFCGHNSNSNSIWKLNPRTGRSHQLRYEMTRHGFPINGDALYGSTATHSVPGGIALVAFKLDFAQCKHFEKFNLPPIIQLELGSEFNQNGLSN